MIPKKNYIHFYNHLVNPLTLKEQCNLLPKYQFVNDFIRKKKDETDTVVFKCNLKREKSINKQFLNNRTEIIQNHSYKK